MSSLLGDVMRVLWERLGFGVVDDEAFFRLVLVRLVGPISVLGSIRVVNYVGMVVAHRNTFTVALR